MPDQIQPKEREIRPPAPEIEPVPEGERAPIPEKPTPKEEEKAPIPEKTAPPPSRPAAPPPVKKDETTMAVEKILEEDLGDLYVKLDPQTRQKIQAEGNVLVSKIKTMVEGARVRGRKVLHLIRDWLKLIPGINKYFLEQEAKIKTDKILDLAEEKKQKKQGIV